ncbi:MAG TPA: hypothetical protein VG936_17610 [Lacunisphaera sp.]|nr:hypothetical protein [Lacunisphaera sp.]
MSEIAGQPEYLHVLVIPALTHALPVAVLGLLLALLARSVPAIRLALVLVLLCAAAAWPAVHYGRAGFDRVRSMADDAGGDWLTLHRYRAEKSISIFVAAAVTAIATLGAARWWKKAERPLGWLTLVVALAACVAAARIAWPAGKVRHREFRHGEPPAADLQAARAAYPSD